MFANVVSLLLYSWVEVTNPGNCPNPSDVARRVEALSPAAAEGAARRATSGATEGHTASLSISYAGLRIDLRDESGSLISERTIGEVPPTCDDWAAAAAVVIATAEAELDPHLASPLLLPDGPATEPPPGEPSSVPSPGASPAEVEHAVASLSSRPQATSIAFRLGLMGSLAGRQLAPGTRVEATFAERTGPLGLSAALAGTTSRTADVGAYPDVARWSRYSLFVGPELRTRRDWGSVPMAWSAHSQVVAALTRAQGVGVNPAVSSSAWQLGGNLGIRAEWAGRPAAPFIGVDLSYYGGQDRLDIDGVLAAGELPHLDVQLTIGISLGSS